MAHHRIKLYGGPYDGAEIISPVRPDTRISFDDVVYRVTWLNGSPRAEYEV